MFLKNIEFLYLVLFQIVLCSENNNLQFNVVSTTQEPSKFYEKPNRVNLEYDFYNIVGGKVKSILQNQFEYQNKIITEMKNQIEKLNNEIRILKTTKCKNSFENNIQTEWQKFEQKQKDQQSLQNNYIKTYLENSHHDLQKLIEGMLQNQSTQHNILSDIKSQFETTRKEILTLNKHNNQLESKIEQMFIRHNNETKAYMENVNNKLAKLTLPKTCKEVQERVNTVSGIYKIWPDFSPRSFDVWCDMETRGGGWIYVINRFDGSVNFNLSWNDYKNGFGNLNGEFWLGLEHLYLLTKSKPNELLIELVDQNLSKAYAHYKEFSIGDEGEGYPIKTIKDYSGDAGNDFGGHLGWKFSTADRDQDTSDEWNCAASYGGGFWYADCHYCLFTGSFKNNRSTRILGMTFRGYKVPLKKVKMIIR